MLYASDPEGKLLANTNNALMQAAAVRRKLMELIAAIDRPHDKNYQDRAFMTGMLSLLDVLFNTDMQQLMDKLEVPDEVTRALLHRAGRLGCELKLVEARENSDTEQAESIMAELGFLDQTSLAKAELDALNWASHIH